KESASGFDGPLMAVLLIACLTESGPDTLPDIGALSVCESPNIDSVLQPQPPAGAKVCDQFGRTPVGSAAMRGLPKLDHVVLDEFLDAFESLGQPTDVASHGKRRPSFSRRALKIRQAVKGNGVAGHVHIQHPRPGRLAACYIF